MKLLLLFFAASLLGQEKPSSCPTGATDCPNSCQCRESYCNLHSARPCLSDFCDPTPWGGKVDASLAFWQAKEEGLDFALNNSPRFPQAVYGADPIRSDINGRLVGIDFDWMPAVKVNLGIEFPHKGWDMDLRWTFFYSHNSHTAQKTANASGSGLFPIWILPSADVASPTIFGKARASWQIHLNTIDLEMGYDFFLTRALSLRLSGGLKGVSIDQKFHVQYTDGVLLQPFQPFSASAQLSNDVLGLGPRIGFTSRWRLQRGFSLLADIAGSFALSVFDMERDDHDIVLNLGAVNRIDSHYDESFWAYRPILECRMGISWDTCYGARKRFPFGLDLAYELQIFWEQNMMRLLVADPVLHLAFPSRGDLSLQGVTLNFRWGY